MPPVKEEQTSPSGAPDTGLLDRQIDKALEERGVSFGGSGGPGGSGPNDRLARLEGVFEAFKSIVEGLRHSQNLVLGVVSLLAVVLIGLSVYELQRMDQLNDRITQTNERVAEVPSKVSEDVRNLTQTLAATITAARQPASKSSGGK